MFVRNKLQIRITFFQLINFRFLKKISIFKSSGIELNIFIYIFEELEIASVIYQVGC